jgi:hypothetical protein
VEESLRRKYAVCKRGSGTTHVGTEDGFLLVGYSELFCPINTMACFFTPMAMPRCI